MGALIGLVRVPPGCSRSASSMRKASRAQAENVAVVATCRATHIHERMLHVHTSSASMRSVGFTDCVCNRPQLIHLQSRTVQLSRP